MKQLKICSNHSSSKLEIKKKHVTLNKQIPLSQLLMINEIPISAELFEVTDDRISILAGNIIIRR